MVPSQAEAGPVIVHTGNGFTVNVLEQLLVQPDAFVTVTVYVPATVKFDMIAVLAVNPPGPVHA